MGNFFIPPFKPNWNDPKNKLPVRHAPKKFEQASFPKNISEFFPQIFLFA